MTYRLIETGAGYYLHDGAKAEALYIKPDGDILSIQSRLTGDVEHIWKFDSRDEAYAFYKVIRKL